MFSYNNPGLPNGLIYEGISTEGKKFIGGSAAQLRSRNLLWVMIDDVISLKTELNRKKSCMAPFLDALIPVTHQKPITDYNYGYKGYWFEIFVIFFPIN